MDFYLLFFFLLFVCGFITHFQRSTVAMDTSDAYKRFQRGYMVVYLLAVGSDWLQGPFIYSLYSSYKFSKADISKLYVTGFLSSTLFGTVMGVVGDKYGRKRNCVLYGVFYAVSCLMKHSSNFSVLLLSRVLSGIAVSLLYSAFESWMIAEHNRLWFKNEWLSETFTVATFGNGAVAILSGLVADVVVSRMKWGAVAPFDLAAVTLVLSTTIIIMTWTENYGDSQKNFFGTIKNSLQVIADDRRIVLLGCVQALFEASMYAFIFLWTPTLEADGREIPHGMVFACFMLCIMMGSCLASVLMSGRNRVAPEDYLRNVLVLAAVMMIVPALTQDLGYLMGCFLVYEICVGIFWPTIMRLRSLYLPEECRSSIMNMFRVPLNIFVVLILLKAGELDNRILFALCSFWLLLAAFCQQKLFKNSNIPSTGSLPESMSELPG